MFGFLGESSDNFWAYTLELLASGGWLMVPLTLLAMLIYWNGFRLFFFFNLHPFYKTPKKKAANYVYNPILADGELRSILDYTQDNVETTGEVHNRFSEIRNAFLANIDGRHRAYMTLVGTAPLTGLLGTVTGMLSTFAGLAVSRGGDTIDRVAGGISEALITTQTGLMIAIPAYILGWAITKRRNELESFLFSLETLSVQLIEKKRSNNDLS